MAIPDLIARYEAVRGQIADAARKSGRDPAEVTLLAVSKKHPPQLMRALAEHLAPARLTVAESYIQEALEKQEFLQDVDIDYHFVGRLQSNKAKFVPGRFACLHSVDSPKLARALHKALQTFDDKTVETTRDTAAPASLPVLLQVNVAREPQKAGVLPEALHELAETVEALETLALQGLMAMPPVEGDPRPRFAQTRLLKAGLEERLGRALPHLSMGMSGDFVAAIEEGATLVRVGTAIFGPRTY